MKPKSKTGIFIISGIILASGISAAYAFGGRHMERHIGHWLAKADANHDGAITLNEVEIMRTKRFAKFDSNRDGVVDQAEIEARIRQRVERIAKRLTRRFDKNRDGRITREEFSAPMRERFSWNDLNDDGKISSDELPRRLRRVMQQGR